MYKFYLDCPANCLTCYSTGTCSKCDKGFYLYRDDTGCNECSSPFMTHDGTRCFSCIENCKFCNGPLLCSVCFEGYIKRNDTLCEKIQYIEPTLYSSEIPEIFVLDFKVPSKTLIENIQKQAQRLFLLTITPQPGVGFSFETAVANETVLLFALKFTSDMLPGTKIKIDLARQIWMTSGSTTQLSKFSFEIITDKPIYNCPRFYRYDPGKQPH